LLEVTQADLWQGAEYGRHAYRALALREMGQVRLAHSAWKSAITGAAGEPDALTWLARIASEWNWPIENEEALTAMVGTTKQSREVVGTLGARYLAEGNTAALRRLSLRLMEADATDENARNDYAILSLLLKLDIPRAIRIAADLHHTHPSHSGYASTHAFALNFQGRSDEALRVIERIPIGELNQPGFAAYYGIILVANGLPKRAAPFLEIAEKGPLLPEENQLVKEAVALANAADDSRARAEVPVGR
jgi:hypothetical protein